MRGMRSDTMTKDITTNDVISWLWSNAVDAAARALVEEYPDATNKERMEYAREMFDRRLDGLLGELSYLTAAGNPRYIINAVKSHLAHYTGDEDLGVEAGEEYYDIKESELPMGDE